MRLCVDLQGEGEGVRGRKREREGGGGGGGVEDERREDRAIKHTIVYACITATYSVIYSVYSCITAH